MGYLFWLNCYRSLETKGPLVVYLTLGSDTVIQRVTVRGFIIISKGVEMAVSMSKLHNKGSKDNNI